MKKHVDWKRLIITIAIPVSLIALWALGNWVDGNEIDGIVSSDVAGFIAGLFLKTITGLAITISPIFLFGIIYEGFRAIRAFVRFVTNIIKRMIYFYYHNSEKTK